MYHSAAAGETTLRIGRVIVICCGAGRLQPEIPVCCATIQSVMKRLASVFKENLQVNLRAYLWLVVCAAAGVAMAYLFDDSCQQDGGQHFLFSRWAWAHPGLFVGVWSRPLFTTIYAFPALIGYRATRLFTVLICVAIAHQTWRLAEDFRIERAPSRFPCSGCNPRFSFFARTI